MFTEIFQLSKNVDSTNYEKLTKIILKEIARGNIQSAHMTPENAQKTVKILDQMDTHREIIQRERDDTNRSPDFLRCFLEGLTLFPWRNHISWVWDICRSG